MSIINASEAGRWKPEAGSRNIIQPPASSFQVLVLVYGLWSMVCGLVWAEEIRLKDGTKFSGTVLEKNGEAVIIGLPRAAVASVDGQSLPPPVAAGTPAPGFNVVDTSGALQSLEAYRGHPTLLQFWATWCPHCRSDLPLMKDLARRYQEKGFRILAVSIDQDLGALKNFLSDQPLPYPVVSVATAPHLPDLYETQGVPAYFLIDPTGVIVKAWSGSVTERESDFEQILAHLLGSS